MKVNLQLGIIFTLISAFCYAVLNTLVKANSSKIPIPIFIFFQSLIPLICLVFIVLLNKIKFQTLLKTNNVNLHIFRAFSGLCMNYFLFLSLKFIPIVDSVLLANTAPFIIPFIAYLFMSQTINHKLWIPLTVGFIGIIIILKPGTEIFNPASLLALCSAICMSISMLLIRKLSANNNTLTMMFYYFLISTIITAIFLCFFWIPLSIKLLTILIGSGILFFFVQYFLILALEYPTHKS